jgi:putative ABC transport system substrate-binding protein
MAEELTMHHMPAVGMGNPARSDGRHPTRRRFMQGVAGIGLSVAGLPLLGGCAPWSSSDKQPPKVYRIGFLSGAPGFVLSAIRNRLETLGWVDGRNVAFEWREALAGENRLEDLATRLVRLKVDVIMAVTAAAVRAAQQATRTVPIVMIINSDPVAGGLISSLGRPGGNTTGWVSVTPDLSAKRLELLKEAVPAVSRVGIFWDSSVPEKFVDFGELEATAQRLGVQLISLEVSSRADLDRAFAAVSKEHVDALYSVWGPVIGKYLGQMMNFAAINRLPAMWDNVTVAEEGGLMGYGPDSRDYSRRAADYVDRILRGARPSDLPVEQPTRFSLTVNLKAARAMGLTISPSVLARADLVIQ